MRPPVFCPSDRMLPEGTHVEVRFLKPAAVASPLPPEVWVPGVTVGVPFLGGYAGRTRSVNLSLADGSTRVVPCRDIRVYPEGRAAA